MTHQGFGMEMNLDQFRIAHHQQAVPFHVFRDVLNDGILREALALDQKLGVKFVIEYGVAPFNKIPFHF